MKRVKVKLRQTETVNGETDKNKKTKVTKRETENHEKNLNQ